MIHIRRIRKIRLLRQIFLCKVRNKIKLRWGDFIFIEVKISEGYLLLDRVWAMCNFWI